MSAVQRIAEIEAEWVCSLRPPFAERNSNEN